MDLELLPSRLTIYARVAFLLCVADCALTALVDDPGHQLVRQAVDKGVRWLAGVQERGEALAELLLSNDEGILIYEDIYTDPNRTNAYLCLEWILSYVSWHMSVQAGEYPDALVAEVTEDVIISAVHQAATVDSYDERYIQDVCDYLMDHFPIEGGNELGQPLFLAEIKRCAGR